MKSIQNLEDSYYKIVKDSLEPLDSFLIEDVDLVCQYIVLRFLKTSSTHIPGNLDNAEVLDNLKSYISALYPFLIAFLISANSLASEEIKA